MATATLPASSSTQDIFPINGTDYVEFYVGNAKQAAHYYQAGFGFQLVGYRGPETGTRDRASYLLLSLFAAILRIAEVESATAFRVRRK